MDQAALDKADNQAAYAPNRQQLLDRCVARSNVTRALRGNPLRFPYDVLGRAVLSQMALTRTLTIPREVSRERVMSKRASPHDREAINKWRAPSDV